MAIGCCCPPVVVLLLRACIYIYILPFTVYTALSSVLFSISLCNRLYIHYIVYISFRFLFRFFFYFFIILSLPCLDCGVVPRLYISFFDPLVFYTSFATQSYNCRHFPRHANLLYADTYTHTYVYKYILPYSI